MKSLGEYLRELRAETGLRLSDVAEKTGVSMIYISQLETSRSVPFKPEMLDKLANFYGVDQEAMYFKSMVQNYLKNIETADIENITEDQLRVARSIITSRLSEEKINRLKQIMEESE